MIPILTQDILFFFDGQPGALEIYEALAGAVLSCWPEADIRAKKTQISFHDGRMFCCASLAKVLPKALRPDPFLTVSFSADAPLASPRLVPVMVRQNRWTHHAILAGPGDVDDELMAWIARSHALTDHN